MSTAGTSATTVRLLMINTPPTQSQDRHLGRPTSDNARNSDRDSVALTSESPGRMESGNRRRDLWTCAEQPIASRPPRHHDDLDRMMILDLDRNRTTRDRSRITSRSLRIGQIPWRVRLDGESIWVRRRNRKPSTLTSTLKGPAAATSRSTHSARFQDHSWHPSCGVMSIS